MEAGCFSFSLARQIKEKTGCEVYVMDPRKLSIIHQSLKKTDKEDAMKLALMAQRFDKNELPLVHIPNEDQEDYCPAFFKIGLFGVVTKRILVLHIIVYSKEFNYEIRKKKTVFS